MGRSRRAAPQQQKLVGSGRNGPARHAPTMIPALLSREFDLTADGLRGPDHPRSSGPLDRLDR
ncbi:Protein of unknown function [Micromonospora lupini str. Lupac 08]|uniref:Uncharacterized protein n=1 Tax=Micromonospora lupini str. Lupac 08 TaxID=1150864 RepID=I0L7B4_9ACTN|nr:Protein of unknown function [Micromonospora lupini str. Lupac 08]